MIDVEGKLEEVFGTIPAVDGNNKLLFHYGDQKELNTVLLTRQKNQQYSYPLLWYVLPNELSYRKGFAKGDCKFVLCHNTKLDWFNDQRFKEVFRKVLQPNFELVLQAIDKGADISRNKLSSGEEYRYSNWPNYGTPNTGEGNEKSKLVDHIDAIGFTLNLSVMSDNNCLK